jgi:oxygen-dependent protoporphyrinogen oxidase
METLVASIASRLRRIELNSAVTGLTRSAAGYVVETRGADGMRTLHARGLILAVPAYAAAPLVQTIAPAAAQALLTIQYPPVTVVYSGWRRGAIGHALDGFGMLVPECERRNILGCIFSSSLFAERAGEDRVLLTTFVGGSRQPDLARLDDTSLREMVFRDLGQLLHAGGEPEFCEIRRWHRAIPQYSPGHLETVEHLVAVENAMPGMFFCANYRGGISVSDCVQSAARAVDSSTAFLSRPA